MQGLKSWMSCSSFIWSRFLTSKDWGIYCNSNLSPFHMLCIPTLVTLCEKKKKGICVLTTSHLAGFHATTSSPPPLPCSITPCAPLPLLVVARSEFNLVLPLNEVLREGARGGGRRGGFTFSEVKLALWPVVVKGPSGFAASLTYDELYGGRGGGLHLITPDRKET